MILTIDKFGRILIPKKVRKALGLEGGMQVEFTVDKRAGTAELGPQRKEEIPPYIKYTDWGWPYLDVGPPSEKKIDTVALIKETRQEYLDRSSASNEILL